MFILSGTFFSAARFPDVHFDLERHGAILVEACFGCLANRLAARRRLGITPLERARRHGALARPAPVDIATLVGSAKNEVTAAFMVAQATCRPWEAVLRG